MEVARYIILQFALRISLVGVSWGEGGGESKAENHFVSTYSIRTLIQNPLKIVMYSTAVWDTAIWTLPN